MKPIYQGQVTNIVRLGITVDSRDWEEDGYTVRIESFIGSLEIDSPGGEDDTFMIKQAVYDNKGEIFKGVEGEDYIEVVLVKNGDRDEGTFGKSVWYEVAGVNRLGLA